ncbi:hypothetical protein MBLNU230_g1825t1 [Neophaeotheca triangularis]
MYLKTSLKLAFSLSAVVRAQSAPNPSGSQYGFNQRPVNQDSAIVEANFPRPNITLYSPAFLRPESVPETFAEGSSGPTPQWELEYWLASIAAKHDWVNLRTADFLSEEGRTFNYLYLSSQSSNGTSEAGKLRVWIQAAQHGDEPAGDQSLLALLGAMDNDPEYAKYLLNCMDIMLFPRYNLDGTFYFQRVLASNFDPNRDHIKLNRQQTRDIKELLTDFGPHIIVDAHEFGAQTRYGEDSDLVHASDGLFAAAKNLNINENIRNLAEELFATNMGADLEASGFRWEPYVTGASGVSPIVFNEAGSDAKIGRNGMGLTQAVTFLTEARGIGLADQEFYRRTAASLTMVQSILHTAADNAATVYNTIEAGIDDFITGQAEIIITDYTELSNRTFQFIDVNSGEVVDQPIQFASTTPVTANLTRAKPQAYLIPRAWTDLATRLEASGLEVTELDYAYSGTVEALNVTSSSLGSTYYEGAVLSTLTTEVVEKEVVLPVGSYWVSTAQRNAALAMVALEPENIDSYASFNIVPVSEGDEYPIFRVM